MLGKALKDRVNKFDMGFGVDTYMQLNQLRALCRSKVPLTANDISRHELEQRAQTLIPTGRSIKFHLDGGNAHFDGYSQIYSSTNHRIITKNRTLVFAWKPKGNENSPW